MKKSNLFLTGMAFPAFLLCVTAAAQAQAQAAKAPYDPGWKFRTHKEHIDVHADGSSTHRFEYAYTLLAEPALDMLNTRTISYHEGEDVLEDVVAYTLKSNGTRVDVPPGNVQVTSHDGLNGEAPAFSDYKNRRLVYPDVEVGDTVVLAYTLKHTKPTFLNHFSELEYYSDSYVYEDAEYVVTAPKSLGLKHKTYNLDVPTETQPQKGLQQWRWRYSNPHARDRRDETNAYNRAWRYQDFPAIEISNFKDYGEIAAAYEAEAAKRAGLTDRVRTLSAEIVQGETLPREKAEKIYKWVVKNISFAGNCLSGGDVVPRDTDTVLNLKMGDCKDHATLMQALLSAQGIKSTQALVNSGSWYEVPEQPCWQAFNHVINYLPDFDIYLDATSSSSPFGVLPDQERGKPTVRTSSYQRVERTPMRSAAENSSSSKNDIAILADGSVNVQSSYQLGGTMANSLSGQFAEWKKSPDFDSGAQYFRRWIEQLGYKGSGTYGQIVADGPSESFSYDMHYRIEGYLDTSNPYGMTLSALVPGPNPIAGVATLAAVESYDHDFLCSGDTRSEELSIAFPDNVKLLAVPHDVHEKTEHLRFDAVYEQQGNALHIKRTLIDNNPGPICSAKVVAQYAKIATAVKKDAKAQAVYQPK